MVAPRLDSRLADDDAAGQERRAHRRRDRGYPRLQPRSRLRPGLAAGIVPTSRTATICWSGRGSTRRRGAAGPDAQKFLDTYTSSTWRPRPTTGRTSSTTLKTATLLELLRLPERAGFNLVEWGYPVLLATLAQALIASVVLILLPLLALRRHPGSARGGRAAHRMALYFAALGLAFLFIEITFIQRFQLFLGHPVYAVSAVLCALPGFRRARQRRGAAFALRLGGERRAAAVAIVGIAAFALVELAGLAHRVSRHSSACR